MFKFLLRSKSTVRLFGLIFLFTVTASRIFDSEKGTIGSSIFVGSEPDKIALSDDSKTLYVGLNGSGSVRKIDLVAQTAGLEFSLSNGIFGAYAANDIVVHQTM